MKDGGVGVTQACMPKVDTGGEDDQRGGGGGGGGGVHLVQVILVVTSVEYHPCTGVLHRETKTIKFNGERIVTCKTMNRDKIFN